MKTKKTPESTLVVDNSRRPKGARKDRLKIKMKRSHTTNPRYMCNLHEYMIRLEEGRGYYVHKWAGGKKAKELQGHWRTFKDCEQNLIIWIMKNDRTGLSVYPGGPPIRQTYYTEAYLKDVSR